MTAIQITSLIGDVFSPAGIVILIWILLNTKKLERSIEKNQAHLTGLGNSLRSEIKEQADVLTNVRERLARLETLISLLLPNQVELPPIVQQADNIKEENRTA